MNITHAEGNLKATLSTLVKQKKSLMSKYYDTHHKEEKGI